jgi:hypothetical protein
MARNGTNHKGGRTKGKKSAKTLEREAVLVAFRQRAMKLADVLLDSQLILARGMNILFRIDKEKIGRGKNVRYIKKRPVEVTDLVEIRMFIEGLIQEGDKDDERDPSAAYYFITAVPPNNQAIDSILNRTFGSPVQSTKLVGEDGTAQPIVIQISEAIAQKNNLNGPAQNPK